jgi:16S rRNA (cytosine1402-N4)-methyltransferase
MRTRRSQSSDNPEPVGHRTVLLHEAIELLDIQASDTVVDATLGGGGHTREIALRAIQGRVYAFDADKEAIERAEKLFDGDARIHLIHANFRDLRAELQKVGVEQISKALFDLGWSGFQLSAGRGFSFQSEEPLSMAYDAGQSLTASTIVNEWGEFSIVDILRGWGEERYAGRIARTIVEARAKQPIKTARELAEIIRTAVPKAYAFGRIHPATKSFQALRIAVNDELGALQAGMQAAWELLAPGGRISVITFHSIEDRIVKQQFRQWEDDGKGVRITKKPLIPSDEEIQSNPRARSAKLRVIEKHHL